MLQQQQSSINASVAPPGGSGDGGQGGPGGPNPPWWQQGRGLIAITAGISAIATLLLVVIIGSIFLAMQTRRPTTMYQFQQVTRGDFALPVSMAGPLQGGTYNIVFPTTGRIVEIDVKLGQMVNKGQVLARLDKALLQDAVTQAQTGVEIAQTAVNNSLSISGSTQGLSGSTISAAQTALSNAQANLVKVQAQSAANVSAAQTALDNAQANQRKVQSQSDKSVSVAQTTLDNARANLSKVQAQSESSVDSANATVLNQCPPSTTISMTLPPCPVAQAQLQQAEATANTNNTTAQNTVDTAQSQLDLARSQAATNNTTAQDAVNAAQSALDTATSNANLSNTTAQNGVNAAQKALTTAMSSGNLSNTSAGAQVKAAQSQLDSAIAQLATAKQNLANATLTAPHAGIVTILNGTVGGQPGVPTNTTTNPIPAGPVLPGTSTFIQIVDKSALQVQGNVGESAAPSVMVGQTAQFTVSAYGQRKFSGIVSSIQPNGVTISNVVTFPVTVDIDMTSLQGAILLPGMTANVTIDVAQRTNVLLIPVNAVNFARAAATVNSAAPMLISQQQAASAQIQAGQMLQQLQIQNPAISKDNPTPAFVLEQSNGTFVVKPVVLGLTDGTSYEVLAGLAQGETIIVGVQRGG
jgi:HlyD family secretion protein